jgi:hypothetical protein
MSYEARKLSNLILSEFDADQYELTNLRLNKLLFLIHGWARARGASRRDHRLSTEHNNEQCLERSSCAHHSHISLFERLRANGGEAMKHAPRLVLPGLDPGIHAVTAQHTMEPMDWIAGSSPAMTTKQN